MNIIDCTGLVCPMPVIHTKKYFDSLENGEAIVIVDNSMSKSNVLKYAANCGYETALVIEENKYKITIKKSNIGNKKIESEEFVVVIGSDKLGAGDDSLGGALMKTYIYAISQSKIPPTHLIFLNSGVKIVSEGSPCIEILKTLKDKNVQILISGTCLQFYGLKEKLEVGDITNMYTIVELMNKAAKTIKV